MYYLTHKLELELELELAFYLELELHLEAQEQGEETATKRANWLKKLKSGEWQTTGKIQVFQGLEQDFVSKQVRSLETGRDKDENHLVSKFARAPGAASVRWEGKTGKKNLKRGVLRAWSDYVCDILYQLVCKYQVCIFMRMYIQTCII